LSRPRHIAKGILTSTQLKEIVMNEAPQLEIVDLGDAKEETKGQPDLPRVEDNQVGIYKLF
jgi:hypothetical protein